MRRTARRFRKPRQSRVATRVAEDDAFPRDVRGAAIEMHATGEFALLIMELGSEPIAG
jgi:hypothetical protein